MKARPALLPFGKASPATHCSGWKGKGRDQHRVGLHKRPWMPGEEGAVLPEQDQGARGERPEGSRLPAGSGRLGNGRDWCG